MARKASGGIKNIAVTSEDVKPEIANSQAVEVKRQTDGPEEMSTTEKLFGDLFQDDGKPKSEPVSQGPEEETGEIKPVEHEPKPEPEIKEPEKVEDEHKGTEIKPIEDDFIDVEKLANKKVKTKIDGVENEITLKDLRDQHQLRVHLNQAADKVGEERRKLAEERRRLEELRNSQQRMPIPSQEQPLENVPHGTNPDYQPILAEIESLKQQFSQYMEGTRPIVYQSNRQRVSDELKSQGFNDFMEYIPRMESHIVSVQNPQLQSFYDTPEGAKALYFQLKAQDLKNSSPAVRPEPIVSSSPSRPPITKIDSGSQPSGGNDDSGYQYRQTFKRAISRGDDKEAWNEVLRQKGIIQED